MQKTLLLLFSAITISLTAQPMMGEGMAGTISGKLIDKATNSPIEYATIAIFRAKDSSLITGQVSKADGSFKFTDIKPGMYYARLEIIGYTKKYIPRIGLFPPDKMNYEMGNIMVEPNTKLLKSIEISGDKGFSASQIDKRIYNPSQLMSAVVGTASDLLNNIPSVNLNSEGGMNFRGNDNITILVDGKPSSLTANSLQQIPAQSIESVEVITNPSAKFNPEGTEGIINIIMKKNRSKIKSGSVTLGMGNNEKYNGAIAYNFQHQKFNLYLNYGYRNDKRWSDGYTMRDFDSKMGAMSFYQDNRGEKYDISDFGRINMEYAIDDKNSISAGGNMNAGFKNEYNLKTNTNRDSNNTLKDEWNRSFHENNNSLSYDVNAAFKREFTSNKHFLIVDFTRNYNSNDINTDMAENYQTVNYSSAPNYIPFGMYNWQKRTTNLMKIDYSVPVSDNYYLEMGFNGQWRDFNFLTDYKKYANQFNELRTDSALSNDFRFLDDIYAIYGTLSAKFGKFSTKGGLRLEQANTRYDVYNHEQYTRFNYFSAFPSLSMSYELPSSQNMLLSYSRRINRPGPGQLNPLQDVQDPTSIRLGNPNIRPEYINSLEIGYSKSFKQKFTFSTNIYYKFSYDAMTRFVSVDSLGRGIVQVQNLGTNINAGWEAIFNVSPKKWLNFVFSSNLSKNELSYSTPTKEYNNGNWVWSGRLNSTFKLPKDFDMQLVGFYRSASATPQGTFQYHSSVDFTVRKKVFKQRGLITAGVSDIFDTMRFLISVQDANFNATSYRKSETRIFTVSFKYNFGADDKKVKAPKPVERRDSGGDGGGDF